MSRSADRQLKILRYLGRGRIMTIKEIAEKADASISTVKRDLTDLSCSYPIDSFEGHNGGYKMDKCCMAGNPFLTKSEIEYIRQAVTDMPDDDQKTTILEKLPESKTED